jgi:3'-5' exoribonuclease
MARERIVPPNDLNDTFRLTSADKRTSADAVRNVPLSELGDGQEADFFALLSEKQELTTRDGKPYHRVSFRDARREVNFPIWSDSPLAEACRAQWAPGQFYKLRAVLRQSNYGPQLEIKRIRPVEDADRGDGFDPHMCQPASRFDPVEMFAELMNIVESRIENAPLRQLVADILEQNRSSCS